MIRLLSKRGASPIGIDLGSRSLKLIQFDADRKRVLDAVRWEFFHDSDGEEPAPPAQDREREISLLAENLKRARQGRAFRGREAVICLSAPHLVTQNIRVPKAPQEELYRLAYQEVSGKLPFPMGQAEVRFLEAADVRQGEAIKREVIVLAAQQEAIETRVEAILRAGLQPIAVDVEPTALLRAYLRQFRRDEDQKQRWLVVHVGSSQTVVVIADGSSILFIKYIEIGGKHMDAAVTQQLELAPSQATALRRHNGDRRADQQDPVVTRSIQEALRPVLDQLASELSMCIRYHSVTFRGQPLARIVVTGGEASPALVEALSTRLDLKCELGDPLRGYQSPQPLARAPQWDVAAGLALKA